MSISFKQLLGITKRAERVYIISDSNVLWTLLAKEYDLGTRAFLEKSVDSLLVALAKDRQTGLNPNSTILVLIDDRLWTPEVNAEIYSNELIGNGCTVLSTGIARHLITKPHTSFPWNGFKIKSLSLVTAGTLYVDDHRGDELANLIKSRNGTPILWNPQKKYATAKIAILPGQASTGLQIWEFLQYCWKANVTVKKRSWLKDSGGYAAVDPNEGNALALEGLQLYLPPKLMKSADNGIVFTETLGATIKSEPADGTIVITDFHSNNFSNSEILRMRQCECVYASIDWINGIQKASDARTVLAPPQYTERQEPLMTNPWLEGNFAGFRFCLDSLTEKEYKICDTVITKNKGQVITDTDSADVIVVDSSVEYEDERYVTWQFFEKLKLCATLPIEYENFFRPIILPESLKSYFTDLEEAPRVIGLEPFTHFVFGLAKAMRRPAVDGNGAGEMERRSFKEEYTDIVRPIFLQHVMKDKFRNAVYTKYPAGTFISEKFVLDLIESVVAGGSNRIDIAKYIFNAYESNKLKKCSLGDAPSSLSSDFNTPPVKVRMQRTTANEPPNPTPLLSSSVANKRTRHDTPYPSKLSLKRNATENEDNLTKKNKSIEYHNTTDSSENGEFSVSLFPATPVLPARRVDRSKNQNIGKNVKSSKIKKLPEAPLPKTKPRASTSKSVPSTAAAPVVTDSRENGDNIANEKASLVEVIVSQSEMPESARPGAVADTTTNDCIQNRLEQPKVEPTYYLYGDDKVTTDAWTSPMTCPPAQPTHGHVKPWQTYSAVKVERDSITPVVLQHIVQRLCKTFVLHRVDAPTKSFREINGDYFPTSKGVPVSGRNLDMGPFIEGCVTVYKDQEDDQTLDSDKLLLLIESNRSSGTLDFCSKLRGVFNEIFNWIHINNTHVAIYENDIAIRDIIIPGGYDQTSIHCVRIYNSNNNTTAVVTHALFDYLTRVAKLLPIQLFTPAIGLVCKYPQCSNCTNLQMGDLRISRVTDPGLICGPNFLQVIPVVIKCPGPRISQFENERVEFSVLFRGMHTSSNECTVGEALTTAVKLYNDGVTSSAPFVGVVCVSCVSEMYNLHPGEVLNVTKSEILCKHEGAASYYAVKSLCSE